MIQHYFFKILFISFLACPILGFAQNNIDTLHISIQPSFQNKNLDKNTWFITRNNDSIQLKKIKFYLTSFEIQSNLEKTSISNSNYLIDIFNNDNLNIAIPNTLNASISQISFNLGVEEHMNTDGALAGDLDPANGMYWSWQSGYINFKIEGISPSCKTRKNKFMFHIGGYNLPFQTTKKISFKIDSKEKNNISLQLDLTSFFNTIDLKTTNQVMIPGKNAKQIADILPILFTIE